MVLFADFGQEVNIKEFIHSEIWFPIPVFTCKIIVQICRPGIYDSLTEDIGFKTDLGIRKSLFCPSLKIPGGQAEGIYIVNSLGDRISEAHPLT